jgi:hypothetical protein
MNRANLILHCGASSVSRERVAEGLTPSRTESWVPMPRNPFMGLKHPDASSGASTYPS